MKNIMDIDTATSFQENYICYRCHSPLVITCMNDGRAEVKCSNPQCLCTIFTKNDHLSQIVTAHEAEHLKSRYVCSRCWGRLIITDNHDSNFRVACANQHCNGTGFVTRYYKDHRKSESSGEYMEADYNLAEALGLRKEHKTEGEILQELGY